MWLCYVSCQLVRFYSCQLGGPVANVLEVDQNFPLSNRLMHLETKTFSIYAVAVCILIFSCFNISNNQSDIIWLYVYCDVNDLISVIINLFPSLFFYSEWFKMLLQYWAMCFSKRQYDMHRTKGHSLLYTHRKGAQRYRWWDSSLSVRVLRWPSWHHISGRFLKKYLYNLYACSMASKVV